MCHELYRYFKVISENYLLDLLNESVEIECVNYFNFMNEFMRVYLIYQEYKNKQKNK
jgi:hypothetical protein